MLKTFRQLLGRLLIALQATIAITLLIGFRGVLNAWLRAGIAVLLLTRVLPRFVFEFHLNNRFQQVALGRIFLMGYGVAGLLASVGSVMVGGPLGWLGVFLSLRLGLIPLWAAFQKADSPKGDGSELSKRQSQILLLYIVIPILAVVFGMLIPAILRQWPR